MSKYNEEDGVVSVNSLGKIPDRSLRKDQRRKNAACSKKKSKQSMNAMKLSKAESFLENVAITRQQMGMTSHDSLSPVLVDYLKSIVDTGKLKSFVSKTDDKELAKQLLSKGLIATASDSEGNETYITTAEGRQALALLGDSSSK